MFACGAAAKPGVLSRADKTRLNDETRILEKFMRRVATQLKSREGFVTPGATQTGACLHVARAVCRRAERSAVAARLDAELSAFLNRLSTALFVAACWADEREVRS